MAKEAVIALVSSYSQADTIVAALQKSGFATHDISVLFPDQTASRSFAYEKHTKAPEGAVAGVGAGGALGGAIGLLAGIGALAIPGLGPFIAAGPIMATLSGAAAGAAVGGVAGALVGLGFPEIEARQYEGKVRDGNILISVHVDDREERTRAKKLFQRAGASDVVIAGEQAVSSRESLPSYP
jgi:hypothetical protein